MQNGNGLNPGDFADGYGETFVNLVQGTLVLPVPGQKDKYHILHTSYKLFDDPFDFIGFALLHSDVDMAANGGLGAVTAKNQLLVSDSLWLGMLTATQHANGRDWWVLTREWSTRNTFYKLLVSPDGIAVDTQSAGTKINDGLGQAVFSPDGSKYAVVNGSIDSELQIFDFDRCSGQLSNEVRISYPRELHNILSPGIAISPNSRFLYFSATDTLYQYDLWADSIAASEEIVGVWDGNVDPFANLFFLAQLASDGRIYLSVKNGSNYLHYIENPDEKGLACDFVQRGVDLMNRNGTGLPNSLNYRLGPLDGSPCDTLGFDNVPVAKFRCTLYSNDYLTVAFTDLSHHEPATWQWDFGDNTTSQDAGPVHTFPGDGAYNVCLSVSNMNGEDVFCKTVYIGTTAAGEVPMGEGVLLVYPNPAKGQATVEFPQLKAEGEVRVFDQTGRLMFFSKLEAGQTVQAVSLQGFLPGLYVVTIEGSGRTLAAKLVVM